MSTLTDEIELLLTKIFIGLMCHMLAFPFYDLILFNAIEVFETEYEIIRKRF